MTRYVPIGKAAEGGLASVGVFNDTNLDRKVAIKHLRDPSDHPRLFDELNALQRIRSKHVVEILDVHYSHGGTRLGIVQEYVDGQGLDEVVRNGVSESEFLRIVYQLATGISEVHAVGIIHRDIKPENIRIDRSGILKVIDFNLARSIDEAGTTGFVGTRGYAAPEQYGTGSITFTTAIDVYAMAVTAWVLLNGGQLPQLLASRPPQPDAWLAKSAGFASIGNLDPDLSALLNMSLSATPSQRPAAAAVARRAAGLLSQGRHRALFTYDGGPPFELHHGNPNVTVAREPLGSLSIDYDGMGFRVSGLKGDVFSNNIPLRVGDAMPHCCVIALGSRNLRASDRMFITMDVSHPEVLL